MNSSTSTSNDRRYVAVTLSCLVFCMVAYGGIAEYWARMVMIPKQNQNYYDLEQNGHSFRVAILGTSHSGCAEGLEPKLFHYGIARTYPIIMYLKTQHLLRNAPNLEVLILEADTHQFFEHSHTTNKSLFLPLIRQDFVTAREKDLLGHTQLTPYKPLSFYASIAPIIHKTIISEIFQLKHQYLALDKVWSEYNMKDRRKNAIERLAHFKLYDHAPMNHYSTEYFEKTIALAKAHNIKVVLIRHPMTNEYLSLMHPAITQEVDAYLSQLESKYQVGIWDYRYQYADRQEFFYNQDHLNGEGCAAFNQILSANIKH